MTKFDEAASRDADGWPWWRAVVRQPGVFVASVVAISFVVCIGAAFLLAAQTARVQVARLIAGTQFAVVLDPQVGRVEAEAMRGGFESIPLVGAARLQTREQALTRLAGSSILVSGRNPLPDTWVLTAREPQTDAAMRSFAADRARLEQILAGMPGVASVRVDRPWSEFVDRWVALALRTLPTVNGLTLGVLAALVFCIAFLAGRTFAAAADGAGGAGSAIVIGTLAGSFGLAIAAAFGIGIGNVAGSVAIEWAGLQQALLPGAESPVVWLTATVLGVSILGTLVGRLR